MPDLDDRARRVLRQHLHTARLLGADAVPIRRATIHRATDAPQRPLPPALVEPKPRAPDPRQSHPPGSDRQARLDELRARYERDAPHRRFSNHSNNIVFGEGDPAAAIAFVGEAPGEEEDRTGRPFVGRAGQLLDKMIAAMGLSRQGVYICNVLKTRPPNNATPTPEEAAACEPYLLEQLAIVAPKAIVTLGKSASQCLLKTSESMSAMRGTWRALTLADASSVPLMPTFHPAYLLRAYTPENRAKVWSDLRAVMDRLGIPTPADAG